MDNKALLDNGILYIMANKDRFWPFMLGGFVQ